MQSTETVLSSKCVCVLNHRWIPVGAIAGDGCCINVSREGLVADSVVLGRKFFVRVGLSTFAWGVKGKSALKRAFAAFASLGCAGYSGYAALMEAESS